MTLQQLATFPRGAALALAVVITSAVPALAGPPLICHPFDIGPAASLPFGDTSQGWRGWQATLASYDRGRLVDDTLALLTPQTPVIVRMETLRRASAYAMEDAARARQLLHALQARAPKAPRTPAEALALFDAGYLVETYRQLGSHGKPVASDIESIDGYAMVKAAMAQVPGNASMEFAAALIASGSPARKALQSAHVQKAREGARADVLLARNVASHFSN